jgi:hypothetical protein
MSLPSSLRPWHTAIRQAMYHFRAHRLGNLYYPFPIISYVGHAYMRPYLTSRRLAPREYIGVVLVGADKHHAALLSFRRWDMQPENMYQLRQSDVQ